MPIRRFLATALAAISCFAVGSASAATTFTGQFTCDNDGLVRPLVGARVQVAAPGLWHNIYGQGFTDASGNFSIPTPAVRGDYFLKVALINYRAFLKDFWGTNEWRIDVNDRGRNWIANNATVVTGSFQLPDVKCAVWQGVSDAVAEAQAIGAPLPAIDQVTIQADSPIAFSTPFTPYVQIHWRGGEPAGRTPGDHTVAKHEFGHVIRHGFDGNEGEFLLDAARFLYPRNHSECDVTNPGFAFNEGWAEYWARDYSSGACSGISATDESVEGNVARALAELEVGCGMNRARMAQILRDNPGAIHSLSEFRARVPACAPLTLSPAPPLPAASPPAPDSTVARALRDISAINARNRTLTRQLALANRAAATVRCGARPCGVPELLRLTRPAEIRAEIASNLVLRQNLQQVDTPAELATSRARSVADVVRWQKATERSTRTRVAKAYATSLAAALKAGSPVFQTNTSPAIKRIRKQMVARLALVRRAQASGAPVPGVSVQVPRNLVARRVAAKPIVFAPQPPAPDRVPAVIPKSASTTTFTTCPSSGKTQGNFVINGTLTPAATGSTVTMTFTPPSGVGATSQTLQTDASGAFSTNFQPGAVAGTWSLTATFAGDATRNSSNATCTVSIA